MLVEEIIARNQRFIPFLMHCLNLLCQKHPELRKNPEKIEEFITFFVRHKVKDIEDKIVNDACEFLKE
ncbi:MAG: hypothetical protein EAX96_07720 [Candidatus Lokiarchaeota archaeon]|nr:hypothetical protein [Candidatus Lokiarchaeota archaeon]